MTLASPVPPIPGLWSALGKLLRLRWMILVKGFRNISLQDKISWGILGWAVLFFAGFTLYGSYRLPGWLSSSIFAELIGDVRLFLETIPALLMAAVFLGTLLTSFCILLQGLYLAGDMDFLLSAPLPVRAVFLSKLLQAILPNFSLICLSTLPVLWGLGISAGYHILYFILGPLLLATLTLAAAGISSLLVMSVARYVPAQHIKEVLGFIGVTLFIMSIPVAAELQTTGFDKTQANQILRLWQNITQPSSPIAWVGQGLVAIGCQDWLPGLFFTLLAFAGCALIFGVTLILSERLYYAGWASLQTSPRKKSRSRSHHSSVPGLQIDSATAVAVPSAEINARYFLPTRIAPRAVRAVIAKDYVVLWRDLNNIAELIVPLLASLLYGLAYFHEIQSEEYLKILSPLAEQIIGPFSLYANVGPSLLIAWALSLNLADSAFSRERTEYWILKQAPLTVHSLLLAKFLVALLPALGVSGLFLIGISVCQHTALLTVIISLLTLILSITGTIGMNLGMGVIGANLDWEDPYSTHRMRGVMRYIVSALNMLQITLTHLLFIGPAVLVSLDGGSRLLGQLAGLLLGGIFNLLWAGIPLTIAYKRFNHMGE